MTHIQRATRALEDAFRHEVAGLPDAAYRDAVRRVLTAIREPSDGQIAAAAECESSIVADVYTTMIDALLAEVG